MARRLLNLFYRTSTYRHSYCRWRFRPSRNCSIFDQFFGHNSTNFHYHIKSEYILKRSLWDLFKEFLKNFLLIIRDIEFKIFFWNRWTRMNYPISIGSTYEKKNAQKIWITKNEGSAQMNRIIYYVKSSSKCIMKKINE